MSKAPFIMPVMLSEAQQDIVRYLEEALAEARRGEFTSMAIALCKKNGYASVIAGPQAADLNLACDEIKLRILEATRRESAPPPQILRHKMS